MSRKTGLYFIIFAVLYFIFTAFIVAHGIHFTNLIITAGMIITGVYFFISEIVNRR